MLNLLATIIICVGLANVSPFNHANEIQRTIHPKKANITANYELNLKPTSWRSTTQTLYGTGNTLYPNGNISEYNAKFNGGNSYLNVIGEYNETYEYTRVTDENNNQVYVGFVDNVNYIDQRALGTCESFLLKITPYNYNVNTNETIRLNASIQELTDINDEDFFAYEIYLKRYIYTTASSNWDSLLGTQLSLNKTLQIKNEIENVNNGFYYTVKEDLIQIGYNNTTGAYIDNIELEIVPQADNYVFVIYRPCVRPVYNTTEQTQPMRTNVGVTYNTQANIITITGTNIIPDGTYEVVNIPGLMFEVLTMPFAFVSQAFNLTIFPGTPYQINIANLFLSIIAILVFVWLMKKFTKL